MIFYPEKNPIDDIPHEIRVNAALELNKALRRAAPRVRKINQHLNEVTLESSNMKNTKLIARAGNIAFPKKLS